MQPATTLPDDPTLPQLATALNPATMQAIFSEALWGDVEWVDSYEPVMCSPSLRRAGRLRITACQIERVKYRPQSSCMITYCLDFSEAGSLPSSQRLWAKLYPLGHSAEYFVKAQQAPLHLPQFGPPLLHLPELSMVVWAFPNDRKLSSLPALTNPVCLRNQLLPPIIAAHWGADWQITDATPTVMQYLPEHTCMVRVAVQLDQPDTGQQTHTTLYGKTYYNQAGAETARLMQALWSSAARQCGQLLMAEPLAYMAEYKIFWQRGLTGATLLTYEADHATLLTHLASAARTVAALHQAPVTTSRTVTQADWIKQLAAMRDVIVRLWPQGWARVTRLVNTLLQQAVDLPPEPLALLHGDLHLQNFLVEPAGVALIDLDDLCMGSPWQELGSFLAGLHYRGLRNHLPRSVTEQMGDHFCQHYAQQTTWPLPAKALRWYVATALINERIARLIARLNKGDLADIERLVARAEEMSWA